MSFQETARFYFNHLPRLTTRPEHVQQLQQSILDLAVRGKLVPQIAAEGDGAEVLRKLAAERDKRIRSEQLKRMSALELVGNESESDHRIPSNWSFCFIDDIAMKVTDGEHLTPNRSQSGRYLLSARSVTNEGIQLSDVDFVPEQEYQRIRKRCDPDKSDILVSCSGSVGRVAIVDEDDRYVMVRSAALIKIDAALIHPAYLAYALRSPALQAQMVRYSKSTAQANLFVGAIRKLRIPVPPYAEQCRISAKIDELIAVCLDLESKLAFTSTTRRALLDATLQEALTPAASAATA